MNHLFISETGLLVKNTYCSVLLQKEDKDMGWKYRLSVLYNSSDKFPVIDTDKFFKSLYDSERLGKCKIQHSLNSGMIFSKIGISGIAVDNGVVFLLYCHTENTILIEKYVNDTLTSSLFFKNELLSSEEDRLNIIMDYPVGYKEVWVKDWKRCLCDIPDCEKLRNLISKKLPENIGMLYPVD